MKTWLILISSFLIIFFFMIVVAVVRKKIKRSKIRDARKGASIKEFTESLLNQYPEDIVSVAYRDLCEITEVPVLATDNLAKEFLVDPDDLEDLVYEQLANFGIVDLKTFHSSNLPVETAEDYVGFLHELSCFKPN